MTRVREYELEENVSEKSAMRFWTSCIIGVEMIGWARPHVHADAPYKIAVMRRDEEPINVTIEPQRSHCQRYRRLHNNRPMKKRRCLLMLTVFTPIRK